MLAPLPVYRAFDRALIAEVPVDDAAATERKLAAAFAAFRNRSSWLKPHQRIDVLRRLAEIMRSRRAALAETIASESGKPLRDALVEVDRAVDGVINATEVLRNHGGREIPMGVTPAAESRWAFTTREPIGVVVAISAFNHPLNLVVHQAAPAIAVGCPIIIKPAAATPLSCVAFIDMVREAGLPDALCQAVVTADNDLAEKLVTDERVAFLSFIGSAKVGWMLRSRVAPGTRCALEHGGVAPVIVDDSADIAKLMEPLARGGYYHAGQVCVSVQRIFVHRGRVDAFLEQFAERINRLVTGSSLDLATDVGPLIRPAEADRVERWTADAQRNGAGIIGGGRLSETTLRPAIIVDPKPDDLVSTAEIFGPATCVYRYDALDEAIERANAVPYAFQASIFTEALTPALRAAERLDASSVMINDHTAFRVDWMPFAGRRVSGLGVGGIPATMHEMTEEKMIVWRLPT